MPWKNRPRQAVIKLTADLEEQVKKIAQDALMHLIIKSPVDTGAYRANHQFSLNSYSVDYDVNRVANDTAARGMNIIASFTFGDKIHFHNSLPYALRIENGWSSEKAPLGVYRQTFRYIKEKYG